MDLRDFDLVLSDSSAFAKAAIKRKSAVHVCYCHTPMRWVWNYDAYVAREGFPAPVRAVLPPVITRLQRWDVATAPRVDRFIANSSAVAQRIRQSYDRSAEVIPPPVEVARFRIASKQEGYFLILSRLAPYKRIDLAVQACTALGLALKVVGGGRDMARLKALAGPSVQFLGPLPDAEAHEVMARCRALIFPGEEDFGIAPVEAQACGRPVIAYAAGGALTTVIPGRTGLFFHEQTVDALMAALNLFRDGDFDPAAIRQHAEYFDAPRFEERLTHALLHAGIFLERATIPMRVVA
jgi:glycosyltransferase involved in cell wall biosynthesis